MIEIEELTDPDEEWDKRLLENDGSFYQTTSYSEYLKRALGMSLIYCLAKKEKVIVAQWVIHIGHRFSKYLKDKHDVALKLTSKSFKTYHMIRGPTIIKKQFKDEIYSSLISYLDEKAKKEAFMIKDISLPIGEEEEIYQKFIERGFYSDSWGTIIVDTTKSEDELWKSLEKSRRNIVRRGINQGLVFKEAQTKEDYEKVIKIIEDMSKRNKIFFHPRKYYQILFETLSQKEAIKTFFIELNGHGIATISIYLFGNRAIQTLVAHTNYALENKISGTDFLEWHIIKWCHDNNYISYDLAGIRPDSLEEKDISLRAYKMRWGGEVVRFPYFSKTYSPFKEKIVSFLKSNYKSIKRKKNKPRQNLQN